MNTLRKWIAPLLVLVVALFVLFSVGTTLAAGAADAPRPAQQAAAQREVAGDGAREALPPRGLISGHGIVEPADREVRLGAQVPGVIAKIEVEEGQPVEKGAPLVQLLADVERAELAARTADLEAAQERAKLSGAISARIEKLARGGASTGDEQDRAVAQAAIDRAAVKQAEARLTEARARLDRLTVKAPYAGTVLQVVVREGEYFNPQGAGASLVTLGDLSKIRVRMDVDERQIGQVREGQSGYVTAKAFGDRRFPGKVVEIGKRMGRKNVRTDEPTERIDTKVLEVVLELEDGRDLVQGLRVVGFLEPAPGA
jgi:HlyD family secretion protein